MKRAFVIIRLSTQDQLKGYGADVQWEDDILPNTLVLGLSVSENQKRVIQEAATGWERSKFEAAVREALTLYQHGQIEALLFPRVDRETRFLFGSFPLLAEVVKAGLHVYFAREKLALDPNDPESVERYFTKATQSQAYVETMKTNTLRAKAKLIKAGILPQGTGIGLYGFKWDKDEKRRVPIDYEIKVLRKMFEMADDGLSRFNIARTLNQQGIGTKSGGKWEARTVGRILTNTAYIGLTYFGKMSGSRKTGLQKQPKDKWMLLTDATPAVIDKELFERVQARLEHSKQLRPGRPKYDYLLTGHIVCGACSSPLIGACLSRKYRYYRCRGAYETASRSAICNARYIKADYIETTVWDKIKDVLQHPEVLISELKRENEEKLKQSGDIHSLDKEITKLRRDLRNYEYQEKRLVKLFRYEEIAENSLLDELNQLKQDRITDEERLAQLQQAKGQLTRLANTEIKLNEFCEGVRQNLEQCTLQDKRLALDALDIKVVSTQQGIDIKGNIPIKIATTDVNLLTTGQTSA